VYVLGLGECAQGTLWVVRRQSRQNNRENEKRKKTECHQAENTTDITKAKTEKIRSVAAHRSIVDVGLFLTPTLAGLGDNMNRHQK
jgi:hypothetical protein